MVSPLFEMYITTKTKADEDEIKFARNRYYREPKETIMSREEYERKIYEAISLAKKRPKTPSKVRLNARVF